MLADTTKFTEAALDPRKWIDRLSELADSTKSDFAQLIGFGPNLDIDFNWLAGERPGEAMSAVITSLPSEQNFRVLAHSTFRDEAILYERHYARVTKTIPSSLYVEACRKFGIEHGCQSDLYEGPEGFIGLALLRSKETGPTRATERRIFDLWRGRAAGAITLQIALEREGYKVIAGTLEAMNSAAYVLDRRLSVRSFTPRGETYLEGGFFSLEGQRLKSSMPSSDRDLEVLFGRIARREVNSGRVLLGSPGGRKASIHVHRLPHREWSFGFEPFAIAVVSEPTKILEDSAKCLRESFGLTAAEAAIAIQLVGGRNRKEIQLDRGVSRETIRSHVRAIYAKLGVRRESELVSFLNNILR